MASEAPAKYEDQRAVRENYFGIDVGLRVLLFSATLVSVIVMATAKQTELVSPAGIPIRVSVKAKFTDSPAFM